jgi:circadian clock protein KaiC
MEQLAAAYGPERRRLRILKMRGIAFAGGYHDLRIATGGVTVYPRLVAEATTGETKPTSLSSGVAPLDALLGGGLDGGTSTLIMGPAGTGKTTIAMHYALTASAAGVPTAIYLFEESVQTYRTRARGMRLPLEDHLADGRIQLRQINPAEMSPGELAGDLGQRVDDGARLVILDTLNGYLNAMPEERFLLLHLHDLLTYLGRRGVATILVEAQQGPLALTPDQLQVSYMADTVLLVRHFEAAGSLRQAVSVLKRRTGLHERRIRELILGPEGLRVGEPLAGFRGVLSGSPVVEHSPAPFSHAEDPAPPAPGRP